MHIVEKTVLASTPEIFRCAASIEKVLRTTHLRARGFPTHLWTHLPVGLSAPFRPRARITGLVKVALFIA